MRARADGQHRYHGTHPDDDAKQGEDGAEDIGAQCMQGHFHGFGNIGYMRAVACDLFMRLQRCFGGVNIPLGRVRQDLAIANFDQPVGAFGHFARMGDDDDGMPLLVHRAQQFHYVFAALAVQCARRFVGKNDASAIHQCTGNRNTLLLAA